MTGIYPHTIDAKGRICVPARIKEELGEPFHITLSMEKCLTIYSDEKWQRLREKVDAMPQAKQNKMRPIFSHALENCEPDLQGRIVLPQQLRGFAGLTKNVVFVGLSGHAQLWDADEWAIVDAKETTPENIAEVFEELDF